MARHTLFILYTLLTLLQLFEVLFPMQFPFDPTATSGMIQLLVFLPIDEYSTLMEDIPNGESDSLTQQDYLTHYFRKPVYFNSAGTSKQAKRLGKVGRHISLSAGHGSKNAIHL